MTRNRLDPSALLERAVLFARGLGFVVLIFFLPTLLRDLLCAFLPGGGLPGLLAAGEGEVRRPLPHALVPLAISAATLALSATFVVLYRRGGPEASRPRPLLRADGRWLAEWGRGFALGVLLAAAALLAPLLAGAIRVEGISESFRAHPELALVVAAALLLEAAREELGFRGPPLRDLSRAVGFPLAALFLAGTFALLHCRNPRFGGPALLGVLFAGLALAGLARNRGDLGMVCGCHAGWNIFVGVVASIPLSGFEVASALLETHAPGAAPWTGGPFGIEASVPGIAVLFLFGLATWRLPEARDPQEEEIGARAQAA